MAKSRDLAFNRVLKLFLAGNADQIATKVKCAKPPTIRKLLVEFRDLQFTVGRMVEEQVEKHRTEEDGRQRVARSMRASQRATWRRIINRCAIPRGATVSG